MADSEKQENLSPSAHQSEEEPSLAFVPSWYREVLLQRRQAAQRGEIEFVDWEVAFAEIKEQTRNA